MAFCVPHRLSTGDNWKTNNNIDTITAFCIYFARGICFQVIPVVHSLALVGLVMPHTVTLVRLRRSIDAVLMKIMKV